MTTNSDITTDDQEQPPAQPAAQEGTAPEPAPAAAPAPEAQEGAMPEPVPAAAPAPEAENAPPAAPAAETEDAEPTLSAVEREYQAAMRAATALGMDLELERAAVDKEADAAERLVEKLGLDQPTPTAEAEAPVAPVAQSQVDEEAAKEEDELLGPVPEDARSWYVLNTYSGHENRVQINLERRIESMDVAERIFRVVVPTEEELEIRGGQRRQVQRKLLPGYVLVEMILDDDTWYVVRNTPGVTGFVGADKPHPLPREEVKAILRQMRVVEPRVRVGFEIGDSIRVMDGPFLDFIGQVVEINLDKGKVRVLISMFGRETPMELDFMQVERA